MELIGRESLIEHMRRAYKGNTKAGFKWDLISTVAVIGAEEEITPKAEPIRHGHWKRTNGSYVEWYECSECGEKASVFWGTNCLTYYCPHCGAKMDEVEE